MGSFCKECIAKWYQPSEAPMIQLSVGDSESRGEDLRSSSRISLHLPALRVTAQENSGVMLR